MLSFYHFELYYPHEQVIDAAAAKAADAAGGGRPATIPAPVEQLMALIFDLEMMRKASAQLCERGTVPFAEGERRRTPGNGHSSGARRAPGSGSQQAQRARLG
jgi:hypothetical protein